MVTEAHHCCLFVLSRWREISLPEVMVSSVQALSEGWISWGRGPCVDKVNVSRPVLNICQRNTEALNS